MAWVDFTNTLAWPSNGRGGVVTTVTTYTTDDTLFTGNTVTGTTFLGTLTNAAIGALIATSDGFWGIITAFDAAPAPDIITVDAWHKYGYPNSYGVPVANSDVKVIAGAGPVVLPFGGSNQRWIIDSIEIKKGTVGDTITITDLYSTTTMKQLTLGGVAAATIAPYVFPCNNGGPPYEGPQGWEIGGPFSVVTSGATCVATVNFRVVNAK